MNTYSNYLLSTFLLLSACTTNNIQFDASGTFEATEYIISSQATGTIEQFKLEEGSQLQTNEVVGYVDSTQLYLKKLQLEAQIQSILAKKPNVEVQLAALKEQLKTAESEQIRIQKLVESKAATQKQLDDLTAQIQVLQKQIAAHQSTLTITSNGISNDVEPLKIQLQQIENQLNKCKIVNPVEGTVLTTYANQFEFTTVGKPLYKIANLNYITLKAYVNGEQLPSLKLNQKVQIKTDSDSNEMNSTEGEIYWISSKAEFTPKTIQTKNERTNMVYAIKIRVPNLGGTYKIGMYGEVYFN